MFLVTHFALDFVPNSFLPSVREKKRINAALPAGVTEKDVQVCVLRCPVGFFALNIFSGFHELGC